MRKVSLMIHTASPDDFLREQGIPSYFVALTETLRQQTFMDFELIYIDTYHAENRARFWALRGYLPYCVKHVPVHPQHRYWYDRGHCFIAAAKNTGILYADSELCVSCDDAEFFPPEFLATYWTRYKQGHLAHALHKRMRTIEVTEGIPAIPPRGDIYVNDHRWRHVVNGAFMHRYGSSCFAGTSFPLADALALNGYNERMDGCKSLDDCDFGNRLRLLGRSFVMDPAAHLYIVDHGSYADNVDLNWADEVGEGQETRKPPIKQKVITNFVAVENHGLVRCATELLDIVANKHPLTPQHYELIRAETIKHQKFDPLAPERAEQLKIWQGTPTFDLKQQRAELRSSPGWEWQ